MSRLLGFILLQRVRFAIGIALIALSQLSVTSARAAEDNLQFVFHPSVGKQNLTPTEARSIFTARQQHWEDGNKIHVFVLQTDSPTHRRFCRQMLQMFPYQLERIWNQIIYSGQGDAPHVVVSQEALIDAVQATPGAVGYASEELLENRQDKVDPQ
ncbi:type 2 periplasmic-binding domain-containing protein [Salinimonas chungwhensis]|uniref:hypothetical protein n=1 Tax=Salinimonas chungwhensis TaxID=265425 RepID=UPI0003713749|nr:hypothetical protein [Salinimonas chungwhensis]